MQILGNYTEALRSESSEENIYLKIADFLADGGQYVQYETDTVAKTFSIRFKRINLLNSHLKIFKNFYYHSKILNIL